MSNESHHVINVAKRNSKTKLAYYFFRVVVKGSDGGLPQAQRVYDELRQRFPEPDYAIDVTYWHISGQSVDGEFANRPF